MIESKLRRGVYDPIGRYIEEAARTPLLEKAEERRLAYRMARQRTSFFYAACGIPALWAPAAHLVRQVIKGARPAMKVFNIGGLSERDFHAHLKKLPPIATRLRELAEPHAPEAFLEGRRLMVELKLRSSMLRHLMREAVDGIGRCRDCRWRAHRARSIHRAFVDTSNALVSANLRLVVHVAKQVARHPSQMLELIQEGNLGLLYATEKYDPREECQFHSYAFWWIKQAMTRAISNKWRLIRQPVNLEDAPAPVKDAIKRFRAKKGRDPSPYELADMLDISRAQAQRVYRTSVHSMSLDQMNDEESALIDTIAAPDDRPQADLHSLQEGVEGVLATLSPREREVVAMRFGLGSDQTYTLEDIGRIYNLSRERVRQIELRALEKLRHPSRAKRLRTMLDSLD